MFVQIGHGYFHKEDYNPKVKRSIVNFNKMKDIERIA